MQKQSFGVLIAAAVANLMAHGAFAAEGGAKSAAPAGKAGHCVHDCSGNAQCKTATNACKGKNDCAGQGLVPKECSSQASVDACKVVKDPKNKKNTLCTWLTEK